MQRKRNNGLQNQNIIYVLITQFQKTKLKTQGNLDDDATLILKFSRVSQ